jgi:hypothetical protein
MDLVAHVNTDSNDALLRGARGIAGLGAACKETTVAVVAVARRLFAPHALDLCHVPMPDPPCQATQHATHYLATSLLWHSSSGEHSSFNLRYNA